MSRCLSLIKMLISDTTVQRTFHEPYFTNQPCTPFSCSVFTPIAECNTDENGTIDWHIGNVPCALTCPPVKKCSKVDPLTCMLGDADKSFLSAHWAQQAPLVTCTYDAHKIDSLNQLKHYERIHGHTANFEQLALKFCQRQGKDCINGGSCSRMTSRGEEGNFCRNWLTSKSGKTQDNIITSYCAEHQTDDCKCINRNESLEYDDAKQRFPFNDNCWWRPCIASNAYLVPHETRKQPCPSNVCTNVIQADRVGGNVAVDQNVINCGKVSNFNIPIRTLCIIGCIILFAYLLTIFFRRTSHDSNSARPRLK